MGKIKMVDLHSQYLRIKDEVDEAIQKVLDSTSYINGPEVANFASNLSAYLEGAEVITCANGTDALQIAMMGLGLKPGDEVIIPSHTYVAPLEVAALLGLTPIFAEVDEATFNIDVEEVRKKVTRKTRAIVPVHLYGQSAHMEPIVELAHEYDLHIIEDNAQSLGSDYLYPDGTKRKLGTIGAVGITSFFPTKSIGCFGDGGAVICRDKELAGRLRMIANHGQKTVKYTYHVIGINSRLDTIQAAILNVKLKYLEEYIEKRRNAAARYDAKLGDIPGISIPARSKFSSHVFHQYTLTVERRDDLIKHLRERGIPAMIYYPSPLYVQPAYQRYASGQSFPVADKLAKTVISLPMHTEMTDAEVDMIADGVAQFYNG